MLVLIGIHEESKSYIQIKQVLSRGERQSNGFVCDEKRWLVSRMTDFSACTAAEGELQCLCQVNQKRALQGSNHA